MDPPFKCKAVERCSFGSEPVICHVTQCAFRTCPFCPILGNLAVKHYCAYGCMRGDMVVGSAARLYTYFGWGELHCFR